MLSAVASLFGSAVQASELALGKSATTGGPIDIVIQSPANFNFQKRSLILGLRAREVLKHPELLKGKYAPSSQVFGQVEDGKPWWGTTGQAYFGAGQNSIVGPAEESRFVLNPFLLAGNQEIYGLPKDRVSDSDARSKSYPIFPEPSRLRWYPKKGQAEVTYRVSSYISQVKSTFGYSDYDMDGHFGLEMINARDLGLKYVYIPPQWAYNITVESPMTGPMLIPQFIHCGGSCGYPGGCNNMSPATAQLDGFNRLKLPARMTIMFWKNAPMTGKEPADMTFTINCQ